MSWRVVGAPYYPFGFVDPPEDLTVENDTTYETVRYVPERTCQRVLWQPDSLLVCSECGAEVVKGTKDGYRSRYCQWCGAKVVEA